MSAPPAENRLARETSPYLLQHRDNPVHWWAWGPDALAEAKATGKPILLSVGYAACHWCHVMAHESFEDDATAAQMNDLFVNIKVDREERPDIDAIYMRALHSPGRAGRLAAHHVPRQRGAPVLGRHLFSARTALRPAFLQACAGRGLAHLPRGARQDQPQRRAAGAGAGRTRAERRPAQHHGCGARRSHQAHGQRGGHAPRRALRRTEVSAVELLLAALARRHPLRRRKRKARGRHHARQHLPGRHLRSPGRRVLALLGRRALARAALREDALRQCAADRPHVRGLPRGPAANFTRSASRKRSIGCCAR